MLKHVTEHYVRIDMLKCLDCLLDPYIFLGSSEYTESIKDLGNGVYEVVFKWRKFGLTKRFKVILRVFKEQHQDVVEVVYKSEPGSTYWFTLRVALYPGQKGVFVKAEALMKAGLMADLFGRKDFADFVERLVSKGLTSYLKRRLSKLGESVLRSGFGDCRDCVLYDEVRGYCYYLETIVADPTRPPCGGKAHTLIKEAAGGGAK